MTPLRLRRPGRPLFRLACAVAIACAVPAWRGHAEETRTEGTSSAIAALVNGMPILRAEVTDAVATLRKDNNIPDDLPADERDRIEALVLDGLIGSLLLYQHALSHSIQVPGGEVEHVMEQARASVGEEAYAADLARRGLTEKAMREIIYRNLMVQRLIRESILDTLRIPEAEIRSWYEENAASMIRPESVHGAHILIRAPRDADSGTRAAARQRAEAALTRIESGETFSTVARETSEDASASRGGDLGWIVRGRFVPELDAAFFALPPGGTSGIVESPFGYHILKVEERREAGRMDIEEAHEGIVEVLRQRRSAETLDKLVGSLRASARIEVFRPGEAPVP